MNAQRPIGPREQLTEPARARAGLNRNLIIETAIAQIDRDGLMALTMRRLGQELGVEAMSIYHHVKGREDLLEGIVDRLAEEARIDPAQTLGPAHGWQAYLTELAHSVRSLAVRHPKVFPLFVTRPPAAPWLRPPLRSLQMVDDFLAALTSRGLSDERAVHAYRAYTSFLLGTLLLEVSQRGAPVVLGEPVPDGSTAASDGSAPASTDGSTDPLGPYPELRRLGDLLAEPTGDAEFAEALEAMLERLERDLRQ